MGKRGGQSFRQPTSRGPLPYRDGLTETERQKQTYGGFTVRADPTRDEKQTEAAYYSIGRKDGLRGNALKEYVESELKRHALPHKDKFKYHRRSDP